MHNKTLNGIKLVYRYLQQLINLQTKNSVSMYSAVAICFYRTNRG